MFWAFEFICRIHAHHVEWWFSGQRLIVMIHHHIRFKTASGCIFTIFLLMSILHVFLLQYLILCRKILWCVWHTEFLQFLSLDISPLTFSVVYLHLVFHLASQFSESFCSTTYQPLKKLFFRYKLLKLLLSEDDAV